ncbi:MAG: hypothetical protein IAF38_07900 [Bacteroidia bacterium]|nr:hypothetical protein [Bacteroidia bacterium]
MESIGSSPINQKLRYVNILSRPNISINDIARYCKDVENLLVGYDSDTTEQAEILMKYEGYIEREKENADKFKRLDEMTIWNNFDYSQVQSLSSEALEKLKKIRPSNLGQASRISGISPSDISILMVYMGK